MINSKTIMLLLSVLFLLLNSCVKEDNPLFLSSGTTSALLNGENWNVSNFATHSPDQNLFHVITTVRTDDGFPIRVFSIGHIPAGADSIIISYPQLDDYSPSALFSTVDIDAICEFFYLSDNHTNLLLIDSLNENTGYTGLRVVWDKVSIFGYDLQARR